MHCEFTLAAIPPSNIGTIPPTRGSSKEGAGVIPNLPPHGPQTKFLLSTAITGHVLVKIMLFSRNYFQN